MMCHRSVCIFVHGLEWWKSGVSACCCFEVLVCMKAPALASLFNTSIGCPCLVAKSEHLEQLCTLSTNLMLVPPLLMRTKTIIILVIMRVHRRRIWLVLLFWWSRYEDTESSSSAALLMIFTIFSLPSPFECWAESFWLGVRGWNQFQAWKRAHQRMLWFWRQRCLFGGKQHNWWHFGSRERVSENGQMIKL